MKYCKKCGMLLEDTIEVCIGCGTDVTDPDNVSKYPPKLEKKIEAQKKQNKTKTTTIIAIIVVFVLLIGLVCLILFMAPKFSSDTPEDAEYIEEEDAEYVPEEEEFTEEAPAAEEENVSDREVKDDLGSYYSRALLTDEGGNLIFTGLYPEDFQVTDLSVNYAFCSNRLPGYVTFIVDDPEGNVRFIYFSPQHFWNRQSEKKKNLASGEDPIFQMTFATYDEGQTYVESLIKKSYPDAKRVELMDTWDANEEIQGQLSEIAKAFKKQIDTHTDYAHFGEGTEYAPMNSEFVARFYRYEVQTKEKNTLFLQFYVPLVSNHIVYSSDVINDHGTLIEWMCLGIYGMVAGNEDLYDDMEPAFQVFMDNCNVNLTFFRILEQRSKDLQATISAEEEAPIPDASMLASYGAGAASGQLSDFDQMLYVFSTRRGGDAIFVLGDDVVSASSETKVAFLNPDKEKVFLSPGEDEYPGDGYEEMMLTTDNAMPDADAMGVPEEGAPEDDMLLPNAEISEPDEEEYPEEYTDEEDEDAL